MNVFYNYGPKISTTFDAFSKDEIGTKNINRTLIHKYQNSTFSQSLSNNTPEKPNY